METLELETKLQTSELSRKKEKLGILSWKLLNQVGKRDKNFNQNNYSTGDSDVDDIVILMTWSWWQFLDNGDRICLLLTVLWL